MEESAGAACRGAGLAWRSFRLRRQLAPDSRGCRSGTAVAGSGRAVDSLSVPLRKGSPIQVARIQAQGEYRNLEGLVDLLDRMPGHGVAITELELEQHRVILGARVLGRAS